MTNIEKADAYFMYLEGSSFQEIADHYSVTKQYIHTLLTERLSRPQGYHRKKNSVYPNLDLYMIENRITIHKFAETVGLSRSALDQILHGSKAPRKGSIDAILKTTGMTYEEAFYTEEESK